MRRAFFWLGVLLGVVLLGVGAVVGISGYAATGGLDGTVRGYFAALARGDASGALGFGDLPDGSHALLTPTVLREQLRNAALRQVRVGAARQTGERASVPVSYVLAFPGQDVHVHTTVAVHRHAGNWRLDATVVPTQLQVAPAIERMSIVGAAVPTGPTLLFPGALPMHFDTPYLQLDPSIDSVSFDSGAYTTVVLQPTSAARRAFAAALRTGLQRCLAGGAAPSCPQPDERYVPGSLRGTVQGALQNLTVSLDGTDPVGTLLATGDATVHGSYRRLNFDNVAVAHSGTIDLPVRATAYAVAPLTIRWRPA